MSAGAAGMPPPVRITTWYLEMRGRAQLRASRAPDADVRLVRAEIPSPALNRFLYTYVGGDWHWTDRLSWTHERWMRWLDRAEVQTWVLYVSGTPAGYVELERQGEDVEIAYVCLARAFVGRGLGGWLLTQGIEKAWDMGARRVWVHTCSLDHPSALANYQARGMGVYKEESHVKALGPAPGPWPGAQAP